MLGVHLDAGAYVTRLQAELDRLDLAEVTSLADSIYEAWANRKSVFIFGNGGSACLASHLAEDLGKGCLREADLKDETKQRLRVLSLTDNVGWLTAVGNDCGYDQVFVQQLMNYGQPGDLAIGISGSGNSPNVLGAVDWANRHELHSFGMTGFDGGKLKQIQHTGLHVALDDMGMVESIHGCVIHWVVDDLFGRINGEGRHDG
ncbi:MAG: SIS domain-containing protein [Planctomycetes bacterium]|nr:SIS domain-containing protein [Planctomycetota bacterium]